jgi:uncharacterized protein (TIGR03067 family)
MTAALPTLLLLAAGALSAPEAPVDETAVDDLTELQGVWRAVRLQHGGRIEPEERVSRIRLVIADDKLTLNKGGPNEELATVKLNRLQSPMEVDLVLQKGDTAKPETIRGVFRRSGDVLEIAFNKSGNDRPAAVAVKEGSETSLLLLKRDKQ